MKISTKGRYALRMMIDIAEHQQEGVVALKDIALRQEVSQKYLEQIVHILCKNGFLSSSRGVKGGYRLTKAPAAYTVGDILRVTEGNLAPVACLEPDVNPCERYAECYTVYIWEGLKQVVDRYFDSITIQDVLDRKNMIQKNEKNS